VKQLEEGRYEVENQYVRSVRSKGNEHARKIINDVFTIGPRKWRGIGEIAASGLILRAAYQGHDAERKFSTADIRTEESPDCISGQILQGLKKPMECPAFGKKCTPDHPLGATMVSSEGACAAYYRYRGRVRPNTAARTS
ncbi:MAG: hydrogenase formation protein HypD, partial [Candidatus Omnitrophica bacterium]|nr:hydrogenase formation protein HypD [Candidatus Omnitrophota bacterium]